MASADGSRGVGKVVGYPPLVDPDDGQRREFNKALLDADGFEDLPGKWQAAILKASSTGQTFALSGATESRMWHLSASSADPCLTLGRSSRRRPSYRFSRALR